MVYSLLVPSLLKVGFYVLFPVLLFSFHVDRAMSTNDYIGHRCNFTANYTAGGAFETNMRSVLSTLTKDAPPVLFANATAGQGSERVYGLVQCRGDVDQDTCNSCISNSTDYLANTYCPIAKDAIIWYEKCQLRYSNTNFFGRLNVDDSDSWHFVYDKVKNSTAFSKKLDSLLKQLTYQATTEPFSRLMFATGNIPSEDLQTIYGLVQCTRDTSLTDCSECLNNTISQIPTTCEEKGLAHGCEIVTGSCRVRFDTQLFYGTTATPSPSPTSNVAPNTTSGHEKSASGKLRLNILVISLSVVVLITCVICGLYWWRGQLCCFWRKKLKPSGFQRIEQGALEPQALKRADAMDGPTFDLATIRYATNDFAPRNELGKGGFGAVYRGQLPDGQEIAVKRLSHNTRWGPKQFDNEVQTLTKLQHRNLVRLLGGFREGEEKILIYEHVRNGSLDKFLFGEPTKRMQLDWVVRSKLINGIARGLSYLHEDSRLRIVHRDLKADNVLLDEDMNPKISDFGTAKILDTHQTQAETHLIMGTWGYMAPEYVHEGRVSPKIDVFSFGVLLLEIISGKKSHSILQETDENLLNYARRLWGENKVLQVVDQTLEGTFVENEIIRCVHIGLLCAQEDASSRPRMSNVVAMLENSSLILPSISPPAPPIRNLGNVSSRPKTSSTISRISSEQGSST